MTLAQEKNAALKIVRGASAILKKKYRRIGTKVDHLKKFGETVTAVDTLVNNFYLKELSRAFPDFDIVSEEARPIDRPGGRQWYVDPLDGTTNFSYGFTEFATLLGQTDGNRVTAGYTAIPLTGELYWAQEGRGAWSGSKKISVSSTSSLKRSMVMYCSGYSARGKKWFNKIWDHFDRFKPHGRMLSCAGLELASVARGTADFCILTDTRAWDVVSGISLIQEAGGRVTNIKGNTWTPKDKTLVASNGRLHDKILKEIDVALG